MSPPRGTCRIRVALSAVLLATAPSCAIPQHKEVDDLSKAAATTAMADAAVAEYARLRAAAEQSLDASALAGIEGGSLLTIDHSSFLLRQVIGGTPQPFVVGSRPTIEASRFTAYPLWFVAVVELPEAEQQAAFVFTRASTTEPWVVRSAPRLAASTEVPAFARDADGSAARLIMGEQPEWSDGEKVSLAQHPQEIADAYAEVLTDKGSAHTDEFVTDSFITQMREIREAQPDRGVHFDQEWTARPVRYVLRLADGGVLMFVDLQRVDRFEVRPGRALNFSNSDAGVYLSGKVRDHARLDYEHQVLMLVPADGEPLVIGQYGGLVDARGR